MRAPWLVAIVGVMALACGGGGSVDTGPELAAGELRWVGLCDSNDICESFDGNKLDPFNFRDLMDEPTGHRLMFEAWGPGEVLVTFDMGPRNCGCDEACKLPEFNERKVKTKTYKLKEGRNLVDVQDQIHKWERDDIQLTAELDGVETIVTASHWPLCLEKP